MHFVNKKATSGEKTDIVNKLTVMIKGNIKNTQSRGKVVGGGIN